MTEILRDAADGGSSAMIAPPPRASRTRRFLDGIWLGYTYQAILMLTGLWLTPFLLHHIGQRDYGVWLVGTQLLVYVSLLDIGVLTLLPRETAYLTGRAGGVEGAEGLPVLVGQMVRLILYQMPAVVLALALAWTFMPKSCYEFRGPIALIMVTFGLTFPLRIFQALLQGLQDFRFFGTAQIISWMISTAAIITLVLRGSGVYALAVGWTLAQLLLLGIAAVRVVRRFPAVLPRRLPALPWSTVTSFLSRGFWITLSQMAGPLLTGADILIIGKLCGASAVVPYVCTCKLITVLSNQPNLLMVAAQPGLSELKTGESRERMLSVITALTQALLMLSGIVACVVVSINHNFVSWWVGPTQFDGLTLTALAVTSMLLRHWSTTAAYSVFCFGHERRICITNLLDGCVTATAVYFLVWRFGPTAAPVGSILGVCAVSLPVYLSTLCREIGMPFRNLLEPLWPWCWRFLILGTSAILVGRYWVSTNLLQTAAVAALTGLVYVAVMFQPGRESLLGTYLTPRLMPLWRRFSCAQ